MASDAAAEDQGEFVGLTDGAIGVEEPLLKGIDGGATTKDEIIAVLYLRKKQPVLNAGVLSLLGSEKGREMGQPLLGTGEQIVGGEGIGEFLQGLRIGTLQERVGAVLGPVVVLRSDVAQHLPTDWIDLAIGPEKADGPLFLLKGLDRGMEQDTIEATIIETDVILMVFVEGVHGVLQRVRSLEHTPVDASVFYACPQSCGADFSGPCGVAQSARIGAGGLLVHGGLSEAGNLRLGVANAKSGSLRPGQHCGRISSAWES